MPFQPSPTLRSRTFIGLIVAQFLAAFNDQAIHASSMFYAIRQGLLTEDQAISLMPILFYAPWAIFCTLAGYLADRYSKRDSLVFWKVAEVGITLVALGGFLLGSAMGHIVLGPIIVLSTVFLMGTHSAFFVPAKYGSMPEILEPNLLSKGNGVLESTSFLAVILGTVSGGILSYVFQGNEYYIGVILLALALLGAAASLVIQRMPAANPSRAFPVNPVKPLWENLRIMLRSRPLALSVLGIAFFTFMVAFMRATVYMHGEVQIPRWTEFHTSLIVATVALGVGLGSYLAGQFSGGKVELGLVPLGAVGMILAALVAAWAVFHEYGLIATLVAIGFFSGFYIVPLYTLLQHRAPKASKGDLIATSNFINVTGAISASLLFFILVKVAHVTGVVPEIQQIDRAMAGELTALEYRHGHVSYFEVVGPDRRHEVGKPNQPEDEVIQLLEEFYEDNERDRIEFENQDLIEATGGLRARTDQAPGSQVIVSKYNIRGQEHFRLRAADRPQTPVYDNEGLPRYLFLGASLMTAVILLVLCRQLPDFFMRSVLWLRSLGAYRLKVLGQNNLPSDGPVVLATNCENIDDCLQVVASTDRFVRFVLLENPKEKKLPWVLRYLTRKMSLAVLPHGTDNAIVWQKTLDKAIRALKRGDMVGLPANGRDSRPEVAQLLQGIQRQLQPALLPVYHRAEPSRNGHLGHHAAPVHVVIGPPLPASTSTEALRGEIERLESWLEKSTHDGSSQATVMIPGGASASPTGPATSHRADP